MSTAGVFRRRLTTIVKVHRRCFHLTKLKKYSTSAFTGIHFPFGDSLHKAYVGIHFLGLCVPVRIRLALSELNGGCITLSAFYHLCKHNCNLFKLAIRYSSSSNRKQRGMCEITQLNGKDYLLDNNTIGSKSKPHKKRIVTSQHQLVDVV